MASDLVWSIKNGDLEQVRNLISKNGVDIDHFIDGRPPLVYAADYGQTAVLEYLLTVGANVNSKDKFGITPLLAAIWEGHTKCVQLLLEKGASKNERAPDGTTYIDSTESNEIKALLA